MDEPERPPLSDRAIDALAKWLDRVGLNGSRLRWRMQLQRTRWREAGARGEQLLRSVRGGYKMCPDCRALVSRWSRRCEHCGGSLARVAAPGVGRLLSNVLPGATTATAVILLVNALLLAWMVMAQIRAGETGLMGVLQQPDPTLLYRFGSGYSRSTLAGEWWRLVTPIFLHAGVLHFAFNSYALLQLGPLVEEVYGTERFWSVYLICGIAGSAASQLPRVVNTVGASGAIFGLMGLLLVHAWRRGGVAGKGIRELVTTYLMYTLVFAFLVRGIDHLNHAGGFVAGASLGFLLSGRGGPSRWGNAAWTVIALGGVLLVLASFWAASVAARA
ncbi:MAG TPA: rhomboid family intramembrane serine protease [Candidatus Polarisedimenticolaceae bacterium]|nr:rhomboid family intramembrane serine protease [Candidatus Polarisedimenticolaceae bacterium]